MLSPVIILIIFFQLESDLGEIVGAAATTVLPAVQVSADDDHMFMIEEVPVRPTEIQPQPLTEAPQPLTEAAQPVTDAPQPVVEAATPVAALPEEPLQREAEAAAPTESVTEAQPAPVPVTEAQPPAPVVVPVTEAEEPPAPIAEAAGAATEAVVAALRDVPTPSVDFGLIQEVTGVLREEQAASS